MRNVTARNHDNDTQVESMMGKAICAYANWKEAEREREKLAMLHGREKVELAVTAHQSEYEATVRCIALFVEEHLPEVCRIVIDRCEEELGVR